MKRILRDERGAAAVEAALVFPLYLSIIFGIIELGNIYWIFNSLQYVADETSRCLALSTCTSSTVGTFAHNSAANIWTSAAAASTEITVSTTSCGTSSGTGYRVKIIHPLALPVKTALGGYFNATTLKYVPWSFTEIAVQSCYPQAS